MNQSISHHIHLRAGRLTSVSQCISVSAGSTATFTLSQTAQHLVDIFFWLCLSVKPAIRIVIGWSGDTRLLSPNCPPDGSLCNMKSLWSEKWLKDESSVGSSGCRRSAITVIISQCRTAWSLWHPLLLIIPSLNFSGGGPRGPHPSR